MRGPARGAGLVEVFDFENQQTSGSNPTPVKPGAADIEDAMRRVTAAPGFGTVVLQMEDLIELCQASHQKKGHRDREKCRNKSMKIGLGGSKMRP